MEEKKNTEMVCPECKNHCPREKLNCPRGMEYFGIPVEKEGGHGPRQVDLSKMEPEEAVIMLMRKCGHFLHHSAGEGTDSKQLLSALSEQEIRELAALLEKCARNW